MKCLNCGVELEADDKFCAKCGFKVESAAVKICKECGKKLAEDAKFCSGCGAKLETSDNSADTPISELEDNQTVEVAPAVNVAEHEKTEAVAPAEPAAAVVNTPVQSNNSKPGNRYIVPESVYFATYIAISDNRLFDREWYQLEDIIKEIGYGDDVRNNVLNIINLQRQSLQMRDRQSKNSL